MLKFAENKKERKRLGKDFQPSPIIDLLQPFGAVIQVVPSQHTLGCSTCKEVNVRIRYVF